MFHVPPKKMPCYHLITSVRPWACENLTRLDATLASGSTPLALPWDTFELCGDGLHFTGPGFVAFASAFTALWQGTGVRRLILVTDSTVDHHDYDAHGAWHGRGTRYLTSKLKAHVPEVIVDSIGGSGFVARADVNEHFRPRLRRHLANVDGAETAETAVVLAGGWNDLGYDPWSRVLECATACVTLSTSARHAARRAQAPRG